MRAFRVGPTPADRCTTPRRPCPSRLLPAPVHRCRRRVCRDRPANVRSVTHSCRETLIFALHVGCACSGETGQGKRPGGQGGKQGDLLVCCTCSGYTTLRVEACFKP